MDGRFQTSFIPKKQVSESQVARPARMGIMTIIVLIIFLTTLALGGIVFGYEWHLSNKRADLDVKLKEELQKFESVTIKDMSKLDTRIEVAKRLLAQHLAVSRFFDFLSKATVKSVRFKNFSFAGAGSKVTVSLAGEGTGYASIVNQAAEFTKDGSDDYITEPTFSGITLDEKTGAVGFSLTATLVPKPLLYSEAFKAGTPVTRVSTTTPSATTTTTTASSTPQR